MRLEGVVSKASLVSRAGCERTHCREVHGGCDAQAAAGISVRSANNNYVWRAEVRCKAVVLEISSWWVWLWVAVSTFVQYFAKPPSTFAQATFLQNPC